MHITSLAFLLAAVLALAGCNGDDSSDSSPTAPRTTTTSSPLPPEPKRRGVVLFLDSANPRPGDTLTLTVENHTRTRLEYGLMYRLERRTGDGWRWVNRNAAFALILKIVEAGRREREEIRLPKDLRPGHYRIVKSFRAPNAGRELNATIELQVR